jgi:hypothetical protein
MTITPKGKLIMRNRRIWILIVSLMMLAVMLAIGIAGCGTTGTIAYDCDYPLVGRIAHDGQHDDCCHVDPCPDHCLNDPCPVVIIDAGTDATIADGGTSSCSGSCVPVPPFGGWEGPGLLWLGPEGTAPQRTSSLVRHLWLLRAVGLLRSPALSVRQLQALQ